MGKERIENFIQTVGKNWWIRKAKANGIIVKIKEVEIYGEIEKDWDNVKNEKYVRGCVYQPCKYPSKSDYQILYVLKELKNKK